MDSVCMAWHGRVGSVQSVGALALSLALSGKMAVNV